MRAAPDRTSHRGRFLVAALALVTSWVALLVACGPGGSTDSAEPEDAPRFAFIRAPGMVVRLDSVTGQAWFVGESGEGGWTVLGRTPSAGGVAPAEGRYEIYRVGQRAESRGARASSGSELLRLDGATGRTWLVEPRDGAEWTEIAEPLAGAGRVADSAPDPAEADGDLAATERRDPTGQASDDARGGPSAKPTLQLMPRERFGESPEEVRKNIAVVLQALQKEGIAVEIKVWGARQLGVLDADVAVPPLLEALQADEPEVVVAAIESLQQVGAASTIPAIMKLQNHADPRVRAAASAVVVEVR